MFNFFKKAKEEPKDLKKILNEFNFLEEKVENLSRELFFLKDLQKKSVQKVGIVRFNPFKEVGGDQSFSLALLDEEDNGIVITSLYSREDNRVYGKPIKEGVSEYSLSEEEKEAIEKARAFNGNKQK